VRAWEREFVNCGTGSGAAISPTLDPIHQLTKVPGPAGFAPASRRRVSAPPRPRRTMGRGAATPCSVVRCWATVPVARGQRPCAPS